MPLLEGYRFRRPVTASHYNGDVRIESYQSAASILSDRQRMGIREPSVGCRDIKEHAPHALRGEFPSAQDTPLPGETKRAADFTIDSRPRDIAAFWDVQMSRLSRLNADLAPRRKIWDSSIDPADKPDAGKFARSRFATWLINSGWLAIDGSTSSPPVCPS